MSFFYDGPAKAKPYIGEIAADFKQTLEDTSKCSEEIYPMEVLLRTSMGDLNLNLDTDESYAIKIEYTGKFSLKFPMEINY